MEANAVGTSSIHVRLAFVPYIFYGYGNGNGTRAHVAAHTHKMGLARMERAFMNGTRATIAQLTN